MNLRALINILDAEILFLLNSEDESTRLLEPNIITSSHIIGVSNNQLWIQNLVKNKDHIDEFKVNSLVDIYSCGEEIGQIIRDINFPLTKIHVGCLYTWIVKFTNEMAVLLTAWKYDHEMLIWNKIGDMIQIIKLLGSEDTIQTIDNNDSSLLQLKHGYISTFIELIDIVTSSLLELEEIDKSFVFTERFLSKTALLISDDFKEDFLEKNSSTSHFGDCGNYDIYLYTESIATELQNETYLKSGNLPILLDITGVLYGGIIIGFEIYQFFNDKMNHITNPWEWFDFVAIVFPTITSIWFFFETSPLSIIIISILLLELR
ncbi:17876_t:CDS:2 [Dentiscutata erythropus]|uniref:17876_t:CDS:1 n=1 Tax=Dentiscutata erythropus TaxID=1348616 RepID=A0A9N8VMF1_9GLOM|nr:17876_t:CDS:2 [Dentiscutata erythropus]